MITTMFYGFGYYTSFWTPAFQTNDTTLILQQRFTLQLVFAPGIVLPNTSVVTTPTHIGSPPSGSHRACRPTRFTAVWISRAAKPRRYWNAICGGPQIVVKRFVSTKTNHCNLEHSKVLQKMIKTWLEQETHATWKTLWKRLFELWALEFSLRADNDENRNNPLSRPEDKTVGKIPMPRWAKNSFNIFIEVLWKHHSCASWTRPTFTSSWKPNALHTRWAQRRPEAAPAQGQKASRHINASFEKF